MIKDPELLKLAIKTIEAEPKRWFQGAWNWTHNSEEGFAVASGKELWGYELQDLEHCGTTLCLAGHVVVLAGQIPLAGQWGYGQCVDPETGEKSFIWEKAADLLGLNQAQIDALFYGGGPLPEFKRKITKVTGVEFE